MVPLTDTDIAELQAALEAMPPPLQPLDTTALDGFLCGVLLQPRPVPAERWQHHVFDLDGRAPPPDVDVRTPMALVQRRHAELQRAIEARDWFDPWIYAPDDDASVTDALLPWVAGFAAAQDLFPDLMATDTPDLVEPLALLYLHFDRDDLEDADALLEVIDTLEPPSDLAEAVQDLVRALMLIADVTRPRRAAAPSRRPLRPRHPRRR